MTTKIIGSQISSVNILKNNLKIGSTRNLDFTGGVDLLKENQRIIVNIIGGSGESSFKGFINYPSDFPTTSEVAPGWWYYIKEDVTDNNPNKTNTGKSFKAGDQIFWDGSTWFKFGSSNFKGDITQPSDFPTLNEVEPGWWYRIINNVVDNDPTKTYTMQAFTAGTQIFWNGSEWSEFGKDCLWIDEGADLRPVLPRGIKTNTIKELNDKYGVTIEDVLIKNGKVIEPLQKTHLNLYVRTNGNDITGDGSSTKPYATIGRAIQDAKKKFDNNVDITINLGPGTYTLNESLFLDFEGNYASYCTITAEGDDTTAMATLESGTFISNSYNVHTDTSKSWAVDSLVGKFIRIKSMYTGTMPTSYNIYLPIIRNGSNWVETAFGVSYGDDIANYDIVDFLVTINANNKSIQMSNKFYSYQWKYIKFQNVKGFGGGSGEETLTCSLMVCHTGNLSASDVMRVTGNSGLYNCFIQSTSSNSLNASAIRSSAIYANTDYCVYLHRNPVGNIYSRNVVRNYSSTKKTPIILRDVSGNASISERNKFINCSSAFKLYVSELNFCSSTTLTTELIFDNTDFFVDIRGLVGNPVHATVFPGGSVIFVNEPNIGRATNNGTTDLSEYFDLLGNINLSLIAPPSKSAILKIDTIKEKTPGSWVSFPDKIKSENIRIKTLGFDSPPIGDPIDIYVDPINGDDSNDGLTPATPKKTLFACSLIPPLFPISPVTIHLGAGTYSSGDMAFSFFDMGWDFIGESFTEHFSGVPISVDVANRSLTYSGVSWTPDEHKGKLLYFPSFAPAGDPHRVGKSCVPIIGNTEDTIHIAADASWIVPTITKIITPDAILQAYPNQGRISMVQVIGVPVYSQSEAFGCMFNSNSIPNLTFGNKITQGCSIIGFDNKWFEDWGSDTWVFYDMSANGNLSFSSGKITDCVIQCQSENGTINILPYKNFGFFGRCLIDGLSLTLTNNSNVIIGGSGSDSLDISNSFNNGITINEFATFSCYGNLTGSNNTGVGVLLMEHSMLRTGGKTSITGSLGDFMFVGGPVKDWVSDVPITDLSILSIVK